MEFSKIALVLERLAAEHGWKLRRVKHDIRGGKEYHYVEVLFLISKKE